MTLKFRPDLERFEGRQLPNASPLTAAGLGPPAASDPSAPHALEVARRRTPVAAPEFTLSRITNPTPFNAQLKPPFGQVLVQKNQPVPGQVYNILSISLRNSTRKTFDASSGLAARLSGQVGSVPVLTGSEQWRPGQVMVFYVLTKKYYPLSPVVSSGFRFNFASGVAIPGPSGIFLRVKYNPTTFPNVLNSIVAYGPGSKGHELGLPDTSIWEFVPPSAVKVPL